MKYKKQITLLPIPMPRHIQYEREPGKREDGIKFDEGIPVEQFTDEEAQEYADYIKQQFLDHHRQLRTNSLKPLA